MSDALLSIRGLKVELMSVNGLVYAVRDINMDIRKGEIHGIVGESGCGKTMTAKSILRLHDEKKMEYSGSILLDGERDILKMNKKQLNAMRGKEISMIFQDPMTTLDPLFTVGSQISEMLRRHTTLSKEQAKQRVLQLLESVGIFPAEQRYNQYPFEMSGGMLQRVSIAMSMCCDPRLIIADEPTTALDVTMQAQVLDLLRRMQQESGSSILIITHNFGVIAEICDTVSVMYAGQIVESGSVREIFHHMAHPYTVDLIGSIPKTGRRGQELSTIPGTPPKLTLELHGCPYAPRCRFADQRCRSEQPETVQLSATHSCRCFHALDREVTV